MSSIIRKRPLFVRSLAGAFSSYDLQVLFFFTNRSIIQAEDQLLMIQRLTSISIASCLNTAQAASPFTIPRLPLLHNHLYRCFSSSRSRVQAQVIGTSCRFGLRASFTPAVQFSFHLSRSSWRQRSVKCLDYTSTQPVLRRSNEATS